MKKNVRILSIIIIVSLLSASLPSPPKPPLSWGSLRWVSLQKEKLANILGTGKFGK